MLRHSTQSTLLNKLSTTDITTIRNHYHHHHIHKHLFSSLVNSFWCDKKKIENFCVSYLYRIIVLLWEWLKCWLGIVLDRFRYSIPFTWPWIELVCVTRGAQCGIWWKTWLKLYDFSFCGNELMTTLGIGDFSTKIY